MKKITKEFNWAMAHMLENHKGLCSNLHGHDYKLFVTVIKTGDEKDGASSEGMVVDFKDLKDIVNEVIVDVFDHSFCYNETNDMGKLIAKFLKEEIDQKLTGLPFRTTAENMSKWIYDELNKYFTIVGIGLKCIKIKLYETDTCYATYLGGFK